MNNYTKYKAALFKLFLYIKTSLEEIKHKKIVQKILLS